jgi:hypothetical protein
MKFRHAGAAIYNYLISLRMRLPRSARKDTEKTFSTTC